MDTSGLEALLLLIVSVAAGIWIFVFAKPGGATERAIERWADRRAAEYSAKRSAAAKKAAETRRLNRRNKG